ncbi:MAG: hypothetical protein R3C20_12460 [Planctomycetaceae bacterium]
MKMLRPVLCVICILTTGTIVVSEDGTGAEKNVTRQWHDVFASWNESLLDPIYKLSEKRARYIKELGAAHPAVKSLSKQIETRKTELAKICPDANFQAERIARIDDAETQRYVLELILKNRALELQLAE